MIILQLISDHIVYYQLNTYTTHTYNMITYLYKISYTYSRIIYSYNSLTKDYGGVEPQTSDLQSKCKPFTS